MLALLIAAPAFAQSETRCWIKGDGHHRHYVCATGDGVPGPVPRAWFAQHCRTTNPELEADAAAAACDADAPIAGTASIATPLGFWRKLPERLVYGAIAVLVAYVIANGGGGAFR